MTRFNLQSMLFTGIVLTFSLLGTRGGDATLATDTNPETNTPTTATAQTIAVKPEPLSEAAPPEVPVGVPNQAIEDTFTQQRIRSEPTIFLAALPSATAHIPQTSAAITLVKEIDSPFVFFETQGSARWPIASVTKLMSAVVAFERIDLNRYIAITPAHVATEGIAGAFNVGETLTAFDVLQVMLVASSNDAAIALADEYGADEFAAAMRETATRIGMHNSSFSEPSGLDPENRATARDLEKLITYILKNHPIIPSITAAKSIIVRDIVTGTARTVTSNNAFAGTEHFSGGKTGYLDESKGNLLSLFTYNARMFLIIVLGSEDRFGDTRLLHEWLSASYNLR